MSWKDFPMQLTFIIPFVVSISYVASLPTLYDVDYVNYGYIQPLDTSAGVGGFGFVNRLSVSAIPTQKGATATKYQVEEIAAEAQTPIGTGFLQSTLLPGTITRTYTMEQGASTLHFSVPPGVITTAVAPLNVVGVVRDCMLDLVKTEGVCVEQLQIPYITVFTEPTAATSTFTSEQTTTYTRPLRELHFTNSASSVSTTTILCTGVFVSVAVAIGVAIV